MGRRMWRMALPLVMLFGVGVSHAAGIQPLQSIKAVARGFLEQQTANMHPKPTITIGSVDPRLRLPECGGDLSASLPPGGRLLGNTTVGVRCSGPKPWSLYVQATVQVFKRVVVSARPLNRGTRLTPADISLDRRDLGQLHSGYMTHLQRAVGMVVTQNVPSGTVLSSNLLAAPTIVHRGDRVVILAAADGLEVRMEGEALEDGAKGQMIRVRNISSKRVIQATVVSSSVVKVGM